MDFLFGQLEHLGIFLVTGAVLWVMGWRWGIVRQTRYFDRELLVNIFYQLLGPIYAILFLIYVVGTLEQLGYTDGADTRIMEGAAPIRDWPLWVQIAAMLLIRDFLQYWMHRWLHGADLWKYHAIHHAPEDLQWHHAYRFHPVNFILYVTVVESVLLLLGFSVTLMLLVAPVLGAFSLFVHTNLRWTYGPFRYVLTSPVFHRWHHSSEPEALDKNFAPNFPFIDLIFGTFYMPKDRMPEKLGIAGGGVPLTFRGQMLYPFRKTLK